MNVLLCEADSRGLPGSVTGLVLHCLTEEQSLMTDMASAELARASLCTQLSRGAGKSSSLAYPAKLNSDALWLGLGQSKMTKMWVLPQLVTSTKENSHFTKQPTSSNSIILLLKHIITEISEMPRI